MEIVNDDIQPVYMGGTGEMFTLQGNDGKNYIYKPAVQKGTNKVEPFRGIVQECAYHVQNIVSPESAVWCQYFDVGRLQGSVQEFVQTSNTGRNYYNMQFDESIPFTQEEINQFMREFVTDYLLCNFDSHGRNFITDENGIIRGVDKEQSFRYLRFAESEKPDINYHPNRKYGEAEPIYNTLFRRYSEGKIDIDWDVISGYMDRVDAVDNDKYREIFVPYCESCGKAFGTDPNHMLDQITARKVNMRTNIESFFQNLTQVREENLAQGKK